MKRSIRRKNVLAPAAKLNRFCALLVAERSIVEEHPRYFGLRRNLSKLPQMRAGVTANRVARRTVLRRTKVEAHLRARDEREEFLSFFRRKPVHRGDLSSVVRGASSSLSLKYKVSRGSTKAVSLTTEPLQPRRVSILHRPRIVRLFAIVCPFLDFESQK